MVLYHRNSGSSNQSGTFNPVTNTQYYMTLKRIRIGGVNGQGRYTLKICTGGYFGQGGTLVDTLLLDVAAGERLDWR